MLISTQKLESQSAIDLTPMIDMVFLLLTFFLAATSFHQAEREMNIALPSAATSTPVSAALREIVVNVDSNGGIIVSGDPTTPDELTALVERAVKGNPEQKVIVRGDRTVAYEYVVRALDACRAGGVAEPFLDTVAPR